MTKMILGFCLRVTLVAEGVMAEVSCSSEERSGTLDAGTATGRGLCVRVGKHHITFRCPGAAM